jgi:hypothetical protein
MRLRDKVNARPQWTSFRKNWQNQGVRARDKTAEKGSVLVTQAENRESLNV